MNKLLEKIKKIPKGYFSLKDLKKISPLKEDSLKVALNRLVASGELIKLGHQLYAQDIAKINLEQLACAVYAPSYLSCETALAYHHILSQQPWHLTLVTAKRSKVICVANKNLIYHHLKPNLFWGNQIINNRMIAEPEKAFLDQAYLSLNGYSKLDLEEMNLKFLNKVKLIKYCHKFQNKKLTKLVAQLKFE
jgi:predicted transcriptional regulator of viral defense system